MADQSQQMVVEQLEQNPDGGGPAKHAGGDLLVPPEEDISSCNSDMSQNSKFKGKNQVFKDNIL